MASFAETINEFRARILSQEGQLRRARVKPEEAGESPESLASAATACWADFAGRFADISRTDPAVHFAVNAIRRGEIAEEVLKALAVTQWERQQDLLTQVNRLSAIVPRLVRADGGKVMRWDCPSEFLTVE